MTSAETRIDSVIASKLDSFFELAEYDWMPARPQSTAGDPSTYVFEMITFLTAYVDSVLLGLNESMKTRAYKSALSRINNWFMVRRALLYETETRLTLYRICCAVAMSSGTMKWP